MLEEYENDYRTGMDIGKMASLIYDYTSGYPYLVSRICKLLDEKVSGSAGFPDKKAAWTKSGFLDAVRILLQEKNTLFESMINKLSDYPDLNHILYSLLFSGKSIAYNPMNPVIDMAVMFGFVKNQDQMVVPANRIFDTLLYNYYLSSSEIQDMGIYRASLQDRSQFIVNGNLNMRLILEKFVRAFQ